MMSNMIPPTLSMWGRVVRNVEKITRNYFIWRNKRKSLPMRRSRAAVTNVVRLSPLDDVSETMIKIEEPITIVKSKMYQ